MVLGTDLLQLWLVFAVSKTRRGKNTRSGSLVHEDLFARNCTAGASSWLWPSNVTEPSLTWIPAMEGKLHVCAIKCVLADRIVGYSIDPQMKSRITVTTLIRAVARRRDVSVQRAHESRIAISTPSTHPRVEPLRPVEFKVVVSAWFTYLESKYRRKGLTNLHGVTYRLLSRPRGMNADASIYESELDRERSRLPRCERKLSNNAHPCRFDRSPSVWPLALHRNSSKSRSLLERQDEHKQCALEQNELSRSFRSDEKCCRRSCESISTL